MKRMARAAVQPVAVVSVTAVEAAPQGDGRACSSGDEPVELKPEWRSWRWARTLSRASSLTTLAALCSGGAREDGLFVCEEAREPIRRGGCAEWAALAGDAMGEGSGDCHHERGIHLCRHARIDTTVRG